NRAKVPNAARIGADDGPGMWIVGGVTGSTRAGARRVGPAVANRRRVSANQATPRTATITGSMLTRKPQSMMTNGVRASRIAFQRASIGGSATALARVQHVP